MSIVLAWMILGAVVFVLSFVPPALISYGDFWDEWRSWNLFIWGVLIGAFALAGALTWAIYQIWL